MIKELSEAVHAEVRALHTMQAPENLLPVSLAGTEPVVTKYRAPPPMFRNDTVVRAVLRIEMDRDAEYRIMETLGRGNGPDLLHAWQEYRGHSKEGPMTFMGVAVYFVEKLPEPGWRVINPMKAR